MIFFKNLMKGQKISLPTNMGRFEFIVDKFDRDVNNKEWRCKANFIHSKNIYAYIYRFTSDPNRIWEYDESNTTFFLEEDFVFLKKFILIELLTK